MSLRFLLDEDGPSAVAPGLRSRGIEVVSLYEIGRAGQRISDDKQLAYAAGESRALVTYNRDDFQALDATWRSAGRSHAGIL